MNLEFLVVALVIGRAVDWIIQTQKEANNKTTNNYYLFIHTIDYAFLTLILTGLLLGMKFTIFPLIILLASHFIIDNRWIVKKIMRLKGLTWEEINSKEYGWLQLGIDQRLHDLVILVIAVMI